MAGSTEVDEDEGPHDAAFTLRSNAQWARYQAIHNAALARADADPSGAFKAAIKVRWLDAFRVFLQERGRAVCFTNPPEVMRALDRADTALDEMDALTREEHKEFKDAVRVELDRLRADLRNESERMRLQRERDNDIQMDRIKVLEQTRPTTGEIEARLDRGDTGKGE